MSNKNKDGLVMATKAQICEKYKQEADVLIKYLQELQKFCDDVISEHQNVEICEYRGDGANDPENLVCARCRKKTITNSTQKLNKCVIPAYKELENNDFLTLEMELLELLEVIDNNDSLRFPEDMFATSSEDETDVDEDEEEVNVIVVKPYNRLFDILSRL